MPGNLQDLTAHISPSAAHEAASFPPYVSHLSRIPAALLTFSVMAEIDMTEKVTWQIDMTEIVQN